MSDHEDEMMDLAVTRLRNVYGGLVACCAQLPLPITLPTGVVTNFDTVPAVRRVEELADEQPMPEEQKGALYTAAVLWLAAADLYRLLVEEGYVEARAAGVLGTLLIARDSLKELGTWLLEQSG
ncbi:hypothetical protein B1H20_16920 [Streptomyces violaceoruber]|uniref:Uncharacterized protein n=1 Tax=Streptomyces violaceoruber TaxID=1935 RepID=A0A1V0UCB7_STRVN|nr:hypothetical protein [Streptomyces violaceoruber]ARF62883.1 hypothetical protein B1H20_16920 [Streptomyces violaceoruber]